MSQEITNPKVFISYSWHPREDKEWVLKLAHRLTSDGIHVIIDEWDLAEGQDIHHFIEQMVLDSSITNVLVIANSSYTTKANNKNVSSGVSKESMIISNEVYSKAVQTKFIPIVIEFDANKSPCLPVFMASRYFVDLSSKQFDDSNYEKLVRRIFNKPENVRPSIGQPPSFILKEAPAFNTSGKIVSETATIYTGSSYDFFDGDISIAVLDVGYGSETPYVVSGSIWSTMYTAVEFKKQGIGFGTKYRSATEYDVRLIAVSKFNDTATFKVSKFDNAK